MRLLRGAFLLLFPLKKHKKILKLTHNYLKIVKNYDKIEK